MSTNHLDRVVLVRMYRSMLEIRMFEERVADLVEAGQIATPCHFCIGQEAVASGVCAALDVEDYVWGAHRSHGHYLAKGGDVKALMAEIFCRQSGCSCGRGGSMHVCAPEHGVMGTVPIVAATIPVAVGAGLAEVLRGGSRVSVAFFGDGATEEGHFHESLNLAALRRLPVLFVCENNFYSSHMSLFERRAVDNIARCAEAHGVEAMRLDGNDVVAAHDAACAAVERARRGVGPTLLECRTFRWRGHVGPRWDMDVAVKRKVELEEWIKKDPIPRCAALLRERGVAASELEGIRHEVENEVTEAVEHAMRAPHPERSQVTEHVYWAA